MRHRNVTMTTHSKNLNNSAVLKSLRVPPQSPIKTAKYCSPGNNSRLLNDSDIFGRFRMECDEATIQKIMADN